jgi:ATP synthase F0 subcomplex A subunit
VSHSPLDQFKIHKIVDLTLFGYDVSLTNTAVYMLSITALLLVFQHLALKKADVVPNKLQSVLESSFNFINSMVGDNVGKPGLEYAPFIFSLFMFILFANLLGMFPYAFTVTSHIAVTFTIAIILFVLITILGFIKHGTHFFRLFLPEGVPLALAPLIIPIELIAYLVRPLTLSMRLFLNMTAGHIMLKVFAGFSILLGVQFALFPALLNVLFIGFEFFVAGLQAFIFTLLTCIYLNDAINLH